MQKVSFFSYLVATYMETSKSETKKSHKRKRVKLECLACHRQFDDDYQTTHNKTFHNSMLKKTKLSRTKLPMLLKIHLRLQKSAFYVNRQTIEQYLLMIPALPM